MIPSQRIHPALFALMVLPAAIPLIMFNPPASRFAKGRGVTPKMRQGLTSFGQGLADEEIAYLCSVVKRAPT